MTLLSSSMKIIADENMPNAKALFSHLGNVHLVDGRQLSSEQVTDADVLLVRSVTKVDQALLAGSQVKFVGSATIGVDHIDQAYLAEQQIAFASAPGCNAQAVADYVFSALSALYFSKSLTWCSKAIGIIGFGNVGQSVYRRFAALGLDVKVYDPFQQPADFPEVSFCALDAVMGCDVVCLHAPLTKQGPYPTMGMLDASLLARLPDNATIISAGRGGIIDESCLMDLYQQRSGRLNLVLDVWANEPNINHQLLSIVDIATPHIAGYSKQGREKGTWMVFQALCEFLQCEVPAGLAQQAISPGWLQSLHVADLGAKEEVIARAIHGIYNVARDDGVLRYQYRMATQARIFDWLRKNYSERDELNSCCLSTTTADALQALSAVGFSIEDIPNKFN